MDQITLSETGCRLILDAARSIRKLGAGWEKNVSPAWTNVIVVLSCFIGVAVASKLVYILLCHASACWKFGDSKTEDSRFHSLPIFSFNKFCSISHV
jgi:hypothetical protein